jgi:hypothetical protein
MYIDICVHEYTSSRNFADQSLTAVTVIYIYSYTHTYVYLYMYIYIYILYIYIYIYWDIHDKRIRSRNSAIAAVTINGQDKQGGGNTNWLSLSFLGAAIGKW